MTTSLKQHMELSIHDTIRNSRVNREFMFGATTGKTQELTATVSLLDRPMTSCKIFTNANEGNVITSVVVDEDTFLFDNGAPSGKDTFLLMKAQPSGASNAIAKKYLCFDEMKMQYGVITSESNVEGIVLSYLELKTSHFTHRIGEIQTPHSSSPFEFNTIRYSDVISESGTLLIKGIYSVRNIEYGQGNVIGFQVIDIADTEIDQIKTFYFRRNQSIHASQNTSDEILSGLVGIEDRDVLNVMSTMIRFGDIVPNRMQEHSILDLIKRCLDGSLATMSSVGVIERWLNHVITTDFRSQSDVLDALFKYHRYKIFDHEDDIHSEHEPHCILIKHLHFWKPIVETVHEAKRIWYYTPTIDIYGLTYLDPTWMNYLNAMITIGVQMFMFILVVMHLSIDTDSESWEGEILSNYVALAMAIGVSGAIVSMSVAQVKKTYDFIRTFGGKHWMVYCMIIANVFIALCIIPLNFLVLLSTQNKLDVVLNSLAMAFVLQMDETVVHVEENDKKELFLALLHSRYHQRLDGVPDRFKATVPQVKRIDRVKCDYIV
eukprot:502961_1